MRLAVQAAIGLPFYEQKALPYRILNAAKVNGDMTDYFEDTHPEITLANFEMTLLGLD